MNYQQQAMQYWKLLQQGVSPADAFAQAFPDGIPTEEDNLREQAKQEQKAGLAQAGGVLAGALGARELARAVAGEKSLLSGLFTSDKSAAINSALDDYFAKEALAYGDGALATPEIVGAERVAEGAATQAAPQTGIGAALPYAGAALGAYGLYDIGRKWGAGDRSIKGAGLGAAQGAASGAAVGSVLPGPGTLVGAILGGLYGLAGSVVKAGKHKDQIKRDAVRSMLQENGFLDDQYGFDLATGQKANLGLDGSATYTGVGGDQIRFGFETDWKNPLTGENVGRLNALAAALTGGDSKAQSDLVSQLNNQILQASPDAASAMQNVRGIYDKTGLSKDDLFGRINALQIDDPTKAAYHNAVNSVFDNRAYGAPGTSDPLAFMQQPTSAATVPGTTQNQIHQMTPQEMAIQKQFGSQLAAALAGR